MSNKTNLIPKVSILVPVYNVEKYLAQCLDSVIAQTLHDLEIICINDGSTDGSLAIIEEYAQRDERIVIISKENSGYGDSMNTGLARATGEYVGIVESDDFVDSRMFEVLYDLAAAHDVDVVKSNFYHYTTGGGSVLFQLIKPDEADRVINPHKNRHIFSQMACIWAGLYRRSFLAENEIAFLPTAGASYQDTSFNFKIWALAQRAFFSNHAFLHYRIDNESSSVNSREKAFCVTEELHEMERFLYEHNLAEELGAILAQRRIDIYSWNLGRLTGSSARDFVMTMAKELVEDEKRGLLDRSILTSNELALRDRIASRPKYYLFLKKFKDQSGRVRRLLGKVSRMIFPSWRNQFHLIELSEELVSANRDLRVRIDDLESRLTAIEEKRINK